MFTRIMAKTDWARLEAIAGGKVYYVDPPLSFDDEVWFYPAAGKLSVWLAGELIPTGELASGPVSDRRTLYDVLAQLFVDIERRGDALVVRRGLLNGVFHVASQPGEQLDALVDHYRARGFSEGSPWGFGLFGTASRQLRKHREHACISVVGSELRTSGGARWYDNQRAESFANPAEASAAAERWIAEREAAGFELRNFELLDPLDVEIPELVPSTDPFDAVERAVAALRSLTREYPRGHFLVEELDPQRDAAQLEAMGYDEFFIDMHTASFNRWQRLPEPPREGSSFAYFIARYGSLTWIVSPALDHQLPTFYCGNVSGGGWSALQLGEELGDAEPLADETPGHGYEHALVFHGGWGRTGYFFDRRQASPTGEWSIHPICLDGPQEEDPPADGELADPSTIEPFGVWLERHVHELVETIRPRLAAIS